MKIPFYKVIERNKFFKVIIYFLVILGAFSLGFKAFGIAKLGTQKIKTNSEENNISLWEEFRKNLPSISKDFTYSFFLDDDRDGLSNAKEIIYGSNPFDPDSDKDGYQDGEEVKKGFDPIKSGEAKLSQRIIRNYSIEYFSWLKKKYNFVDPQIKEKYIDEFFKEYLKGNVDLVFIDKKELNLDNSVSLDSYLKNLKKIKIPAPALSYKELIKDQGTIKSIDINNLKELISSFELAYNDLKSIKVPEKAKDLHLKLLTIVKNMSLIFQDLPSFFLDPVKIYLNNYKFYKLIKLGMDAEIEKNKLSNSLK